MSDAPEPAGVPASIAAIMASIRAEVLAPSHAADLTFAGAPLAAGDPAAPPSMAAQWPVTPAPVAAEPPGLPPTLDDAARALLAPMLRDWLDAHLPEIVEAAVHTEIRRLTGLTVDKLDAPA